MVSQLTENQLLHHVTFAHFRVNDGLRFFTLQICGSKERLNPVFVAPNDPTVFSLDCDIRLSPNARLLTLIYVGGQIPMNTYLLKGYFDSIPVELDESAKIDGASNMRVFLQIIIPLSRPMLAVVAMNGFTGPLGDFALSSVLLRNPQYYTLPIGLYKLVTDKMGASYTTFAAGALLISIPIALVFIALQKHFVSGLTAGGTKG